MANQLVFILKVIILSTLISALIKYGGPLLPIIPTPFLVSIMVFSPTAIVALALWWRGWQQSPHHTPDRPN